MLVVKLVLAPGLLLAASLLARRAGEAFGGWLVALPLTSAPVAFVVMHEQGRAFAAVTATSMMAATSSQVIFALCYRVAASRGPWPATGAALVGFAASTMLLITVKPSFALSALWAGAILILAVRYTRARALPSGLTTSHQQRPTWDLPLRMFIGGMVVLTITMAAPVLGPHLTGLLSPLPVLAAVLTIFAHHQAGIHAAKATIDGLVVGLISPAVFFAVTATLVESFATWAFVVATAAALVVQVCVRLRTALTAQ